MQYSNLMFFILFYTVPSFTSQNTQWKKNKTLKFWSARVIVKHNINYDALPIAITKEAMAREISHALIPYIGKFAANKPKIIALPSMPNEMQRWLSIVYSPDDTKLILGSNLTMANALKQNNVYIYDLKTKKIIGKPNTIKANPHSTYTLQITSSNNVITFSPEARFRQFTQMQKEYESKNGKYGITLDENNLILIDKTRNSRKALISNIEPNDIAQLDFNQDSSQGAFLGGFLNMPTVFDTTKKPLLQQLHITTKDQTEHSECKTLTFNNETEQLAVARNDHSICIWESHFERLKKCTHTELTALQKAVKSWQDKKPHQISQDTAKDIPEIYREDPNLVTLVAGEKAS